MSCPYMTISHFTAPCDLVWNRENTCCSVNGVHCSEKHDFVKWFRSAVKIFPVFTTIDFQCPKIDYLCRALKKESETDLKVRVLAVPCVRLCTFCTPVHLVRMVHVFSGQHHFYRNGLCRSSMPTNPLAYLPPPILTLLVYSMLYRLSFCLRNEQKLFWERLLKALSSHHSL